MAARGRKKGPPDPYKGISNDWRGSMESAKDEEIDKEIKSISLSTSALEEAEKADDDLKMKRTAVSDAALQYRQGKKENGLKIRFLRKTLESRGRDVPVAGDFGRQSTQQLAERAVAAMEDALGDGGGTVTVSVGGLRATLGERAAASRTAEDLS